jgi:protoporphyrinogen oxidase
MTEPNLRQNWAVLGGGMLGLALALRLAQRSRTVTVIEAAPSLGGLTASFSHSDIIWDRYYHVIESGDQYLLDLLSELGLADRISWAVTKTNFYDGEALYPLNNVFDYLRLPVLSPIDKARLGFNILYGSVLKDGVALERQKVSEWLIRWSGQRKFEKLWRPLLRAKLGDNADVASAAYIWAVIQRFYGARQGQSKTELFGYVRGGYAQVIEALVRALRERGVTFAVGSPVTEVARTTQGICVTTEAGSQTYDQVAVTFASPIAARICAGLTAQEKARHEQIQYQGIVCASVLLKRALGGAYLTYITDERVPFTTVIEMSSLVDRKYFGGHHLVYLPKYVPSGDAFLDASDSDVEQLLLPALLQMFPGLTMSDIDAVHVARTRYVTAIATINYSTKLPPMQTAVPGLYICNSAHIVNASLSVNETIDRANRSINEICG